jgi:phage-related protein
MVKSLYRLSDRGAASQACGLGGSSRKDLRKFPDPVQHQVGYAIYIAQRGGKHRDAKVLTGFGGAGVLEVVEDFRGDTFRAVHTLKYSDSVYVLHAFQK